MTRMTSARAWHENQKRLSERRREAYNLVCKMPHSTAGELGRYTTMAKNDLSTRLGELCKGGAIRETGHRRCGVTGQTVTTYASTEALFDLPKTTYYCVWAILKKDQTWTTQGFQKDALNPSAAWNSTKGKALKLSDVEMVIPYELHELDVKNNVWILSKWERK